MACRRFSLVSVRAIYSLGRPLCSAIIRSSNRRTFFASSTDHTSLLQTAKVHTVTLTDPNKRQYLLVPDAMPLEVVLKEPKLGLACLYADKNVIFGAKVINRTLGTPTHVCARLVDTALADAAARGDKPLLAKVSLGGLSEWVLKGLEGAETIDSLSDLQTKDAVAFAAVRAIASDGARLQEGQIAWQGLATEFARRGLSQEADLYTTKGARLVEIESLADVSKDNLLDAGGAMAIYAFSEC